jgi:tRNA pseudouridine13 synthase
MNPLPFLTRDFPGIGGAIKQRPEDFFVQELPLYEPSGEGEHVYAEVQKVGITTFDAINRIASALDISSRDIGYAGMKDAHAIARQIFSIPRVTEEAVMRLQLPGMAVQWAARHGNKLRLGHLRGNRFAIRIREVNPADVVKLRPILNQLEARGVPNYFGEQRFGRRGDNADLGAALLRGEDKSLARADKRLRRLWISALQSELFNQVVARRIDALDRLLEGDLACRHDSGACFTVENPADEQPRCDRFEISPTGPMLGYRMTLPAGEPLKIEQEVFAAAGLNPADFRQEGRLRVKGARRPLRFRPEDTTLSAGVDEHGPHITAAFTLPAGAFATVLLAELMKTDTESELQR